ncbi:MAG: hypothetical protein ACLQE9_03310 [Roseiarcus sp.]
MFSEDFTRILNEAATELQRSPTAFQNPALHQVALVLQALSRELQQLNNAIELKPDGSVAIKGRSVTIDGSGDITVRAAGALTLKGSKILQN